MPWTVLIVTSMLIGTGLAYSLLWGPLVLHRHAWIQPGDIWGTLRAAHYIGWGDIGDVYIPGTGFITTPGIAVLLAPVAVVVSHFALSESYPWVNPHPTAWPLLACVMLLLGSTALFALDAVAAHLAVPKNRRATLCVIEGVLLWPVLVIWGHPEDGLALALALWGLLAVATQRWRRGGWLFGLALAVQPLVLLLVPIALVSLPTKETVKFMGRLVLPAVALLAIPISQSWQQSTVALIDQPTFPGINHPTPLLPFAIQLAPTQVPVQTEAETRHGHFVIVHQRQRATNVVAPGPGRLAALGIACGLGLYARRRRVGTTGQFWLGATALASWSVLEPVMTPYYIWPPLALGLILTFRQSRWRSVASSAAALFTLYWSERFLGPWEWWAPLVAMLSVVLLCGYPGEAIRKEGGNLDAHPETADVFT